MACRRAGRLTRPGRPVPAPGIPCIFSAGSHPPPRRWESSATFVPLTGAGMPSLSLPRRAQLPHLVPSNRMVGRSGGGDGTRRQTTSGGVARVAAAALPIFHFVGNARLDHRWCGATAGGGHVHRPAQLWLHHTRAQAKLKFRRHRRHSLRPPDASRTPSTAASRLALSAAARALRTPESRGASVDVKPAAAPLCVFGVE